MTIYEPAFETMKEAHRQNQQLYRTSSPKEPKAEATEQQGPFKKINDRTLGINLYREPIWFKRRTMIGYEGGIKIKRPSMWETGFFRAFRQRFLRQSIQLSKGQGQGTLYIADNGKKVILFPLTERQALSVKSTDVLAFDDQVQWQIRMMKHIAGTMRSGLFHIEFKGPGIVAMTCPGDPLLLPVTSSNPIFTNPSSTLAWSGQVKPSVNIDASAKTLFGRGSGNSVQFKFEGQGYVIIKPQ